MKLPRSERIVMHWSSMLLTWGVILFLWGAFWFEHQTVLQVASTSVLVVSWLCNVWLILRGRKVKREAAKARIARELKEAQSDEGTFVDLADDVLCDDVARKAYYRNQSRRLRASGWRRWEIRERQKREESERMKRLSARYDRAKMKVRQGGGNNGTAQ